MDVMPDLFGSNVGLLGALIPLLVSLFVLVANVVIGIIAVSMAKKRNLRPVPAFFAGFFAGVLALFFIALSPKADM